MKLKVAGVDSHSVPLREGRISMTTVPSLRRIYSGGEYRMKKDAELVVGK